MNYTYILNFISGALGVLNGRSLWIRDGIKQENKDLKKIVEMQNKVIDQQQRAMEGQSLQLEILERLITKK